MRARPNRGFTLIEVLVVVSIIVILAAITINAVGSLQIRAKQKKTEVMVEAVNNALQAYFADFRDYPPDGFDAVPGLTVDMNGAHLPDVNADLTINPTATAPRKNSSCLIYFLMLRHVKVSRMGADGTATAFTSQQTKLVGPYLPMATLDAENFSVLGADGRPDLTAEACEVLDGFGWPLEYDRVRLATDIQIRNNDPDTYHPDAALRTLITQLVPVSGKADYCPSGAHSITEGYMTFIDPRRPILENDDGCVNAGAAVRTINVGSYDVWSHGRAWSNPRDDIGNFRGK